jgi:hypothetical protein
MISHASRCSGARKNGRNAVCQRRASRKLCDNSAWRGKLSRSISVLCETDLREAGRNDCQEISSAFRAVRPQCGGPKGMKPDLSSKNRAAGEPFIAHSGSIANGSSDMRLCGGRILKKQHLFLAARICRWGLPATMRWQRFWRQANGLATFDRGLVAIAREASARTIDVACIVAETAVRGCLRERPQESHGVWHTASMLWPSGSRTKAP